MTQRFGCCEVPSTVPAAVSNLRRQLLVLLPAQPTPGAQVTGRQPGRGRLCSRCLPTRIPGPRGARLPEELWTEVHNIIQGQ